MKKRALSFLLLAFTLGIQGMEEDQGDPSLPIITYPASTPPKMIIVNKNEVNALAIHFQKSNAITEKEDSDPNNNSNDNPDTVVTFPQAHFSPNIVNVIQKLIHDEKEEIKGALYQFTYYPIAQAMADRLNQNVQISLVIDRGNVEKKNKNSKEEIPLCVPLNMIIKAGGKIHKKNKSKGSNESYENMHHKFLVLKKNITDKPLVMTGSFNITGNAHQSWENIVILDDTEIIKKFEDEFNEILQYSSKPLKKHECVSPKDTANTPQAKYSREINGYPTQRFLSPKSATDPEVPEKCLIKTPPEDKKKATTNKRKPSTKGKSELNKTV